MNMNTIKFETRILPSSLDEIKYILDCFFIDIKSAVFKKAMSTQKKYFEIRDAFHYFESRKAGGGPNKMLDIELVDALKEMIFIKNNLNLLNCPKYNEWSKENDSYCWLGEMSLSNRLKLKKCSVENFNDDYNRIKEIYIDELIETLNKDSLAIIDFEIEFYFTNYCDSDDIGEYLEEHGDEIKRLVIKLYKKKLFES